MRNVRLNWPWRWLRHGIIECWDDPPPVFIGAPRIAPPEFGIIDPDVQRIRAEERARWEQQASTHELMLQQALAQQQAFGVGYLLHPRDLRGIGGNPWGIP